MRKATLCLLALAAGFATADFGNDPPVPGRKPVYYFGGWKSGVEIEIVYDLMCYDSMVMHPIFQAFLDMKFLDSTVREQVQFSYTFLPLPYHHGVWIPHKLVPMFLDQCFPDKTKCVFEQYLDYCFKNQDSVLGAKDVPQDTLIQTWTKQVADALKLNQADLLTAYDNSKDTHNSEMRTRYMYKYNAHHHVSGTPFAIVNGIILQDLPNKPEDWMAMLTAVFA